MTINEMIESDFKAIFPSILQNPKSGIEVGFLFGEDIGEIHETVEKLQEDIGINEDEREELLDIIVLFDWLATEYEESAQEGFDRLAEKYKDKLSFLFFSIKYKVLGMLGEDRTDEEIVSIYSGIFKEHSELFLIEDFLTESEILFQSLGIGEPSQALAAVLIDPIVMRLKTYMDCKNENAFTSDYSVLKRLINDKQLDSPVYNNIVSYARKLGI